MNKDYLKEADIRFEALQTLREIQAQLVGVSFLSVIAIMKPENPLKKTVLEFQDKLDELTSEVADFIKEAKNDVEYQPDEEVEDEVDNTEPEIEVKPEEVKDDKSIKEFYDSSKSIV